MAFIEMATEESVTGTTAELFEAERVRHGYVPNYVRLFAERPAVYAAWRQLLGAVTENIDDRRYELATLAASRRLRSSYCTLAQIKAPYPDLLVVPLEFLGKRRVSRRQRNRVNRSRHVRVSAVQFARPIDVPIVTRRWSWRPSSLVL